MKKVVALVIAVAFLMVAGFAVAADCKAPTDVLVIKADTMKKPPVPFEHAKHAAYDCTKCHHTYKGEGAIQKCTACHKDAKDGKKLDIKEAAHQTCCGCHRDMKKAGEKTGPTPCTGCHKK
ncbi:MAG: cytochrome c3 family protein [Deltaproteobacteria bacterium]|nr:cytochrome c3 family protein [Candidatus Anaeroferrophillus wilburensis]MBN2888110.1 cytochrome c3 family protein [Deltaproteobacteria bacterium]